MCATVSYQIHSGYWATVVAYACACIAECTQLEHGIRKLGFLLPRLRFVIYSRLSSGEQMVNMCTKLARSPIAREALQRGRPKSRVRNAMHLATSQRWHTSYSACGNWAQQHSCVSSFDLHLNRIVKNNRITPLHLCGPATVCALCCHH